MLDSLADVWTFSEDIIPVAKGVLNKANRGLITFEASNQGFSISRSTDTELTFYCDVYLVTIPVTLDIMLVPMGEDIWTILLGSISYHSSTHYNTSGIDVLLIWGDQAA